MIIGLGGLGVPSAIAAARAGVTRLGLIDPDPVELSNLARQVIYREFDLGALKVEAAARYLRRNYPALKIETFPFALDDANGAMIEQFGFVIDATDTPATKFLINDLCIRVGRPFVYGGVLGTAGQAMSVIPGHTACLRCLFEYPPAAAEAASCREAGIIGPIAGAIGAAQGDEAARYLCGRELQLANRILTYDAVRTIRSRVAVVAPREGCGCGAWNANRIQPNAGI
ncbi:MAG: HesA/MoeB/ThiF family protein [Candidatus Binataceae bacterium]|nr:HesA/MoeB/ThiF family protein [Candidatus Binataceae bacterium]